MHERIRPSERHVQPNLVGLTGEGSKVII